MEKQENNKNNVNACETSVAILGDKPLKPKSKRSSFVDVSIIYLILMTCFVAVRIASANDLFAFMGDFKDIFFSLLIQVGIMLILPISLYMVMRKKSLKQVLKDFRFRKINAKAILLAVGIGVLVYILNIAVSSFFSLIISILGYENISSGGGVAADYTFGAFIVAVLTTALLPGFCEEIASRGMLLKGFQKLGFKKMILFSGILFGLMHLNVEQFFYATIIGWFLAFICITTGNIIPGMIIHFMNNALSCYVSYGTVNGWPLCDLVNNITALSSNSYLVSMAIIFIVLIVAVFLLLWLVFLLLKQTTGIKLQAFGKDLGQTFEKLAQNNMNKEEHLSKETMLNENKEVIEVATKKITNFTIKQTYFPSLKEKVWLYMTFCLGGIITLFSFIWGTL